MEGPNMVVLIKIQTRMKTNGEIKQDEAQLSWMKGVNMPWPHDSDTVHLALTCTWHNPSDQDFIYSTYITLSFQLGLVAI